MTNEEIRRLVMEATAKVTKANPNHTVQNTSPPQQGARNGEILVLLSEHSSFPGAAFFSRFTGSGQVIVAGFGGRTSTNYPYWDVNNADNVSRLLDGLEGFSTVCLYAPGFSEMARLASLQDDDLFTRVLLQRLFAGKEAGICFDHDPAALSPKLRNRLEEALKPLEALGFSVNCAHGAEKASSPAAASEKILLEEDILNLHRQGQTSLHMGEGMILTPLAADRARELGIEIER